MSHGSTAWVLTSDMTNTEGTKGEKQRKGETLKRREGVTLKERKGEIFSRYANACWVFHIFIRQSRIRLKVAYAFLGEKSGTVCLILSLLLSWILLLLYGFYCHHGYYYHYYHCIIIITYIISFYIIISMLIQIYCRTDNMIPSSFHTQN